MAYKSLEEIIDVIRESVDVIDVMKPIYNFKASEQAEDILPTSAEAEMEEEMFTMPIIDNLVVLAAVLEVPMDEIIVIDVNMKAQISA